MLPEMQSIRWTADLSRVKRYSSSLQVRLVYHCNIIKEEEAEEVLLPTISVGTATDMVIGKHNLTSICLSEGAVLSWRVQSTIVLQLSGRCHVGECQGTVCFCCSQSRQGGVD